MDLICHYHFLENVGSKLYEKPHAKLTAALRRLKIQSALRSLRKDLVRYSKQKGCLSAEQVAQCVQSPQLLADLEPLQARRTVAYLVLRWLEDYGADLQGEYFPFDLPEPGRLSAGVPCLRLAGEASPPRQTSRRRSCPR